MTLNEKIELGKMITGIIELCKKSYNEKRLPVIDGSEKILKKGTVTEELLGELLYEAKTGVHFYDNLQTVFELLLTIYISYYRDEEWLEALEIEKLTTISSNNIVIGETVGLNKNKIKITTPDEMLRVVVKMMLTLGTEHTIITECKEAEKKESNNNKE